MRISAQNIRPDDIITEVTRYTIMRDQRMVYLDLHQVLAGKLAGDFICVPNLINIMAEPHYQGVGKTAESALNDCLAKIKDVEILEIFPTG